MDEQLPVLRWARTAQLGDPLPWGRVEAEVLAREPLPSSIPTSSRVIGAVAWGLLALIALPVVAAPAAGLVLALEGTARVDRDAAERVLTGVPYAFGLSMTVLLFAIRSWSDDHRRRNRVLASISTYALVCAAASVVVLTSAADRLEVSTARGVATVAAATALVSLGCTLLSRPRAASRRPPRRGPRGSREWQRYVDTRSAVLDILVSRDVVDLDEADRTRLREMPLGYWKELDGVDDAEWRRILELRTVGWRAYDESDRRPWPTRDGGRSPQSR